MPDTDYLEPSQLVVTVADRLARHHRVPWPEPPHEAFLGTDAGRAWLIRRTLEELGIHCESAALEELAGFLIASRRGVEIVTSLRLSPAQEAQVYTQLLAQALLEPARHPFFVRFEYIAGRGPERPSAREVRTRRVAEAVGRAILEGRLDGAPKLLYRGQPTESPGGLRQTAAHILLCALHRTSATLYWRSQRYQRVRAWTLTSVVITKLEELLGQPAAVAG